MRSRNLALAMTLVVGGQLLVRCGLSVPIPNEYWLSPSTNTANAGTLADPYNASTQPLFDRVMSTIPSNSVIHLMTGTYESFGTWEARSGGWPQVKSGQKIIGSGMDRTIIHLCSPGTGSRRFGTPGVAASNIEISELTIDGAGTTNTSGIILNGDHMVVRRVKVVNLTAMNSEIFPLYITGGPGPSGGNTHPSEGNLIEECEVNLPNINWVSGICIGGTYTNWGTGIIRNNRVLLGGFRPGLPLAAFNLGNDHDLLVEGNYVEGGNWGIYSEAGFSNLMIHHNTFKNVGSGIHLFIYGSTNVTCSFNTIELNPSRGTAFGFFFNPKYDFSRITIMGNLIRCAGPLAPGRKSYALFAPNATGVSFVNNIIDNRLSISTASGPGINIYNNTDPEGNLLPINQDPAHNVTRTTVTTSGTYTVQDLDSYIAINSPGLNTVSLPAASGRSGREFVIAREDGGNSFTLSSRGGTINGAPSLIINKSGVAASATVVSDGANWHAR